MKYKLTAYSENYLLWTITTSKKDVIIEMMLGRESQLKFTLELVE